MSRWRLALLWLSGLVMVALMSAMPIPTAPRSDYLVQDTYYVVTSTHYTISLGVMFGLFSLVYVWLEARVRRPLALLHFGLTLAGAILILSPPLAPRFLSPPLALRFGAADLPEGDLRAFKMWNAVSAAGYVLMLAGLGVFVLTVGEALWRRTLARFKSI